MGLQAGLAVGTIKGRAHLPTFRLPCLEGNTGRKNLTRGGSVRSPARLEPTPGKGQVRLLGGGRSTAAGPGEVLQIPWGMSVRQPASRQASQSWSLQEGQLGARRGSIVLTLVGALASVLGMGARPGPQ